MRALAIVCGLAAAACGRGKFDSSAMDAPAATDAPAIPDARPCTFGAFGAPTQLAGPVNSSVDDWTPSISASDLTLVFYSQRASTPGEPDIWVAKRSSPGAQFAAASVITEVSSAARDVAPHLTADELELWFLSDRAGGGTMSDIYVATRTSTSQPFGAPTLVADLSTDFEEDSLWISGDGLRIMFSSNVGTSVDIYEASRADRSAAWSTPTIATTLSTLAVDTSPALSADELEVFFVSNRAGGVGKFDIWHATRAGRGEPFSTPTNIPTLSSTEDEWGLSLSADARTLYYSYSATLSGGNADIWVATRPCQ